MSWIVQTPDEWLAALIKPSFKTGERFVINTEDYLVVCAGFEDRALAVLQNTVLIQTSCTVLLINYLPFLSENKANDIRSICQRAGHKVIDVTYNREEPSGFGEILLEKLLICRGRIFIDISAMSRLLIVQVIVALRTRPAGFDNCFVMYAEAKEYPPSQTEAEAKLAQSQSDPAFSIFFLSSGVFDITVIPELSSFAPAVAQTRLIAFPSLDAHQLTALRAEIQPSRISLIEGVPPSSQNKWRKQVIEAINGLDQFQDNEKMSTSTFDYQETLDSLLKLYAQHSVFERLLISPTGSKMQTVAVGLFRAFIEDVQIVYPTPVSFLKPDAYTTGVGSIHILPLSTYSPIPTTG